MICNTEMVNSLQRTSNIIKLMCNYCFKCWNKSYLLFKDTLPLSLFVYLFLKKDKEERLFISSIGVRDLMMIKAWKSFPNLIVYTVQRDWPTFLCRVTCFVDVCNGLRMRTTASLTVAYMHTLYFRTTI